jgi:hypothetical protein
MNVMLTTILMPENVPIPIAVELMEKLATNVLMEKD